MKNSVVIVGAQWGDEGKGKIVDILMEHADIVVRFQGGNNAGHTVIVEGVTFKLHLLPSGVIRKGKKCIIGAGVVVDPEVLLHEIAELKNRGYDTIDDDLCVSKDAHIIMPYHKALDNAKEVLLGDKKIGTTGRGIGPCYEDKVARDGIKMGDLLSPDILKEKIEDNLKVKNLYIEKCIEGEPFDAEKVYDDLMALSDKLSVYIKDTSYMLHQDINDNKKVLFEGAQGTLLDISHGTYPYVTSSNTVASEAATGSGVGPNALGEIIGITKAYSTRVGEGPYPTELDNKDGEELRKLGGEFGTTTGRARRCGWLDMVALNYACRVNGMTGLVITKLDVLDKLAEIKICTSYEYMGSKTDIFPSDACLLKDCKPLYETLPGWEADTTKIKNYDDLPENAKKFVEKVKELTGVKIYMVSVGPDRDETIILENPFK